jgi:hypothetical protein
MTITVQHYIVQFKISTISTEKDIGNLIDFAILQQNNIPVNNSSLMQMEQAKYYFSCIKSEITNNKFRSVSTMHK